MVKTYELNPSDTQEIFLGLLARERDLRISIMDAKKYGLVNLDVLQSELMTCIKLQRKIG